MRTVIMFFAVTLGLAAITIAAPTPAEAQYYGGGYGYYQPYYAPRYYAPRYYAPRYYRPRYYRYY